MGETNDIPAQSALLIEMGEPEAWLETMLRASRRQAQYEAARGDEGLADRWRKLSRALDYASAAATPHPLTEDSAGVSQGAPNEPQLNGAQQPQADTAP